MTADDVDGRMLVAWAEQVLAHLLRLRSCHFYPGPSTGHQATNAQGGDDILSARRWNWLLGQHIDLPVQCRDRNYGRFELVPTPGVPVSLERRLFAVALVQEVGSRLADVESGW
jgi:hypothetical protein